MDTMKVVNAKGFDFKELKVQCKAMNDAGILDKKINIVGKKEDIVERFIASIDSIPEGDPREKKIPDIAVTLYNAYVEVIDAPEDQPIDLVIGTPEESVGGAEDEVEKKKEKKEKKEKKKSKEKKEKMPGVIATIFFTIRDKGPVTCEDILNVLIDVFPERHSDRMKKTIQAQIGGKKRPLRMEKEKGVKFNVDKNGYSLNK